MGFLQALTVFEIIKKNKCSSKLVYSVLNSGHMKITEQSPTAFQTLEKTIRFLISIIIRQNFPPSKSIGLHVCK
jgi:hypothetical protein